MSYVVENLSESIVILAFKNVLNARLIKESISEDMRIAVVDLNSVATEFHLRTAVIKALVNENIQKMKTKSITNEILYQLSATTNINESTKHCGISDESTLIAFVFVATPTSSEEALLKLVSGENFLISDLGTPEYLDANKTAKLVKLFKITAQELEFASLDDAIATRLATKDCL